MNNKRWNRCSVIVVHVHYCDIDTCFFDTCRCDISIKDIQCGEQKCVALQLILSRLTEEKSETVLKGTLSFLDTGSSKDELQNFQLHLKRYGTHTNNDNADNIQALQNSLQCLAYYIY